MLKSMLDGTSPRVEHEDGVRTSIYDGKNVCAHLYRE